MSSSEKTLVDCVERQIDCVREEKRMVTEIMLGLSVIAPFLAAVWWFCNFIYEQAEQDQIQNLLPGMIVLGVLLIGLSVFLGAVSLYLGFLFVDHWIIPRYNLKISNFSSELAKLHLANLKRRI